MQGTIVMLMALSGLGCHHKSCDVTYVPSYYGTGACYSGSCYGGGYATVAEPSCYSGCYSSGYSGCYSSGYSGCYSSGYGCYGGGYDSCYSGCYSSGYGCYGGGYDSCYSGRRHGCLLSGLFHCFGGWGGSWKQGCGLFGGHHRGHGYDDGSYGSDFGGDYYSTSYSNYSPAVFGSSIPIYETPMNTGQGAAANSSSYAPATPAPEIPATPAPCRDHTASANSCACARPRQLPLRRCRPLRPWLPRFQLPRSRLQQRSSPRSDLILGPWSDH